MKRFLSLILALAMAISLLPTFAVSASAEEAGGARSYYFCAHATTEGIANLSVATDYNTALGRYWKFKAIKGGLAASSLLQSGRLSGYMKTTGDYIALEISVPKDDIYKTEYLYYKLFASEKSYGGKGEVYILPEGTSLTDLAAAKAAGTLIASVDYSPKNAAGAGIVKEPVVKENVELKKGDNILLFVATGKGENANTGGYTDYYAYPNSLTLTPMSEVPPTNPAGESRTFDLKSNKTLADGEEKLIASGESAEATFPASDTDGWSAYCYSAGAEYFQSNDAVNRTISQIGGDGLKLSINTVGDWIALKIPVPKRGIYDVSLSYKQFQNYASADVYMIKAPKEELSETERRAYIEEKLPTALKYASIDCNAADKFITPVSAQYPAEFSFSATEDNSEYLLVFKSTSSIPQKKKLLLDTLTLDGSGTKESSLSEFVYDFSTKAGIEGNSNPVDAKYADTLSLWEGYTSSGVKSAQAKSAFTNISFKGVGDFVAFKINLPASDTFVATVGYYKHASSGDDGNVYILPGATAEEDVASSLTEDKKLTSVSYYIQGDEAAGNYVTDKVDITLPAGEHIVVFNASAYSYRNTGSGTAIYPGSITFKRKSSLPPYSLIAENAMLVPGETTDLTLQDYDGNPIDEFEIREITSSDESIATADGTTVTAKDGFGRAKIAATVAVSGEEIVAEGYVRVINKGSSNLRVSAKLNSRSDAWINPGYKRDKTLYTAESDAVKDIGGFDPGDGITEEFTNGWSWYGDNASSHNYNTFYQENNSFLRVRLSDGQWFAIKMNFENSGHYRAVVNHRATKINAYADMYFIPVPKEGEQVSDYLTDEYKLGEIMNYNPDVEKWNAPGAEVSSYVGDAYVDAPGQYLAVIKMTGRKATGNQYLYFNDLIFTGANPITKVSGAAVRSLMPGDTITLDKSLLTLEDEIPEYREGANLSFESLTPDIVSVNAAGVVTGVSYGIGKIKVTASYGTYSCSGEYVVYVGSGKTRRSYYTDEKVENARKNIERYEWARDERDAYIREADKLLSIGADTLYGLITTQELLRASTVGYRFRDTGMYQCLYCDKELSAEYSQYPWIMDPYTRPWKLQCPDCKRLFPSNDFGKFYELGLDENGNWHYLDALQRHHEMFVCPTYNATGECSCSRPAGTIESWIADLEARTAALAETLAYPEPSAGERGSEEWNSYYGYGVKGGYLYNDTYGEKNDAFFAVDDGFGYEQVYQVKNEDGSPAYNDNGTPKVERRSKPFIGYYNSWGLWEGAIPDAIEDLAMAYLYTDDIKYGRLGAIMIDRIADVYPEMDNTLYGSIFQTNDGNTKTEEKGESRGRIVGRLHDCNMGLIIVPAYDALWPAYEDEWVKDYLSEKAEDLKLENPKTSAVQIRTNIENNYLREINTSMHDFRISSNFGYPQRLHVMAAVVLDTLPETQEWVEFTFKSGGNEGYYLVTGGNVYAQLMNVISRDGHGDEAAPAYNSGWIGSTLLIGEALRGYDKVEGYDLYSNPKMKRMLTSQIDLICASIWSPNVGDNQQMGKRYMAPTTDALRIAYDIIEDEEVREKIVKVYYLQMRGLDKLHGSIFDEDPEEITRFAKKVTDESVEISLPSRNLTGYGMAILRDGEWIDSTNAQKNINTQRDFYMWYGMARQHDHGDKLSLGFHAFGLDVGADIGTPRLKSSGDPHRGEFVGHTLSHNTVMVDNLSQPTRTTKTNPLHFDSASRVQLMEVEAPWLYSAQGVEEYQRTLVMVDVDDDISYGVDFFRILGGNDHLYSFHTLSREAEVSENVVMKKQTDENGKYIGSYQGVDKTWGGSYINSGDEEGEDGLSTESWFGEVDRAENPSEVESFSVDWKIRDNGKVLNPAKNNLHVRLTMLPSFKLDEITTSSGIPPQLENAMDKVRFLFARHTGAADGTQENGKLSTLFTSVIEPYDTTRYVKSIESVEVIREDGAELTLDEAKAVKVTLTSGREDYIVYAKDNTVPYKVFVSETESFDFCGFVGVVSIKDEKIIYTYINDGSAIADKDNLLPAYTGTVVDFERDLSEKNHIDVALNEECEDVSVFENKYIYVENNLSDNGSYRIESAEKINNGVRLNIGDTTLIASYADDDDFSKGYNYNIKEGNVFTIPMGYEDDNAPVFDELSGNFTTSAGSAISVTVNAKSPLGEELSYSAVRLPRGASFNEESRTLTWKPDASQIGNNVASIDAIDASGRASRITFEITVYGSTTGGSSSDKTETPEAGTTTPSGAGGGGGGGGGAAPETPETSDKTDNGETGTSDENVNGDVTTQPDAGNGGSDAPQFIDLGNYAWAADAINTLADDGIIRGTTSDTYSPGRNITRADFASLLVRAFKLESDNTENFADVSASDYFAPELAIARNTGIVNGIGDNKYAPRNTITRQDMMVIVYRALQTLNVEFGEIIEPNYEDFDTVAEYAKEAVSALISAGLVNGKSGRIAPTDYTTRAEVAVLIKRILEFTK